jgi:hypothetical protein
MKIRGTFTDRKHRSKEKNEDDQEYLKFLTDKKFKAISPAARC